VEGINREAERKKAIIMSSRSILFLVMVLLLWCLAVSAQNTSAPTGNQAAKPEIKHVPAGYTSRLSGKEMYNSY